MRPSASVGIHTRHSTAADAPVRDGLRVMLVDGDQHARSALRLLLEQEPEVGLVRELDTALDLLWHVQRARPNLVFVCWDEPVVDTAAIVRRVRAACPQVALVALSCRPEAEAAALTAGAAAFVCKGENPDRLVRLVQQYGREGAPPAAALSGS